MARLRRDSAGLEGGLVWAGGWPQDELEAGLWVGEVGAGLAWRLSWGWAWCSSWTGGWSVLEDGLGLEWK